MRLGGDEPNTVWFAAELVYVGMSGTTLTADQIEALRSQQAPPRGLYDRLRSHRSGRRGSDQFCLYVFDRLVLPELTPEEVELVRQGQLSLDEPTRVFVQQHLYYRFVVVPDGATALDLERHVRRGALEVGVPLLNPLP